MQVQLSFLMVGHTHEDVDQICGIASLSFLLTLPKPHDGFPGFGRHVMCKGVVFSTTRLEQTRTQSLFMILGEKERGEVKRFCGKRRSKNSDWQISYGRAVQFLKV